MTIIAATPVAILRSVGGLIFDATISEAHTSEIEITSNPIELGSEVSDHFYAKQKKLTISAGVSDSPLHKNPHDQFLGRSRSQAAFELLLKLQVSGEPFDIQTGLKLYSNMMCKVIRVTQTKDTDQVLEFEADFLGVLIVSTQVITYAATPVARSARSKVTRGEQQGKQTSDASKKSSLLSKLLDILHPPQITP